jgi:histidinol-phosphate aminotransferase
VHDLDPARIVLGNGSGEILTLISQSYASVGDEILFTEHGFSMYRIYALSIGATPIEVAETDRVTDVDTLIAGCTENTKIVFVANPNNPTGTFIPVEELERLADGIPATALLVLDGAYAEFVDGYDGGASLVEARENVIMTRTFSKVYGLGGIRVGWAYAPQAVIDVLNRMRGPFNVNRAALAAAEAAMNDRGYLDYCLAENAKWGAFLTAELNAIGIDCDDSFANFVLARFETEEEADSANDALAQNGIIVRQVKGYKLPKCLRITIGQGGDCGRIISVLKAFKEAAL